MNDRGDDLRERLRRLADVDDDSNWDEVQRRARVGSRVRKSVLLAAAGLAAVALAAVPAFGDDILGLFRENGKPVRLATVLPRDRDALRFRLCRRLDLVTRPRKRPEYVCRDGRPKVEEIANDGRRFYWKISYPDGRTCLVAGSVRPYRDRLRGDSRIGMMGCADDARRASRLVPTPQRPITTDIGVGMTRGDRRMRLLGVSGLAGAGVATVGLVAKREPVLKTPVKGRAYSFGAIPNREWVAIAAYDEEGREVYREELHLASRRPVRYRRPGIRRPRRSALRALAPLPSRMPRQHTDAGGVSADVYGSGFVAIRFHSASSPGYRFLREKGRKTDEFRRSRRVSVSAHCSKVAYGAGTWKTLGVSGASTPLRRDIRFAATTYGFSRRPHPLPVDICSVRGHYGRRWNDRNGTRDAVELAFTPLGQRFFHEQAAARDLAYFVRSERMTALRDGMKRGARARSAAAIARRFGERVVALRTRSELPPAGSIGVWSDEGSTVVVSRRAETGRKLYVELRSGRIGPHNLSSLAFVF